MNRNILDAILGIKNILSEMEGSFFLFLFPTAQWYFKYVLLV